MPTTAAQETCIARTETHMLALAAAYTALAAYTEVACDDALANDTDVLNWIADLMADLHHLVDALGADWDAVTRLSETYHCNEK